VIRSISGIQAHFIVDRITVSTASCFFSTPPRLRVDTNQQNTYCWRMEVDLTPHSLPGKGRVITEDSMRQLADEVKQRRRTRLAAEQQTPR
jgi:hypothetical protein